MEVYLKVLEKLEVSDENGLMYSHSEHLALNSDHIIKIHFAANAETKEFILIKTTQGAEGGFNEHCRGFKNIVTPVCFIEHNDTFFVVFEGGHIKDYHFQEHFDLEHLVLILKTFAMIHSNFLSTSSIEEKNDHVMKFYELFENHVQTLETHLNAEAGNIDLMLFKQQFHKILATLKETLDKEHLVPNVGSFHKNKIFFKYDCNGKPSDCKILMSNCCKYVPPLYNVLVLIFDFTNEDIRKEYLQEFLQVYHNMLDGNLERKIFNSEELCLQTRNFTPLIKLSKFIFSIEQSRGNREDSNLQELVEYLHCPNLLREECHEVLLNYLGHTKYSLQAFSLTPLQQRCGNLGDYFKLKMNINLECEDQEVNLFVKCLPSNNESTNAVARNGPSKKEDFFYNFFVKEFEKSGLKEFLNFAPKCFLSKINHILVLEDLGLQGYGLKLEDTYFTYDMLTLTVRKLGQLHACSLVFEEKKSKELVKVFRLDEHYGDYLEEILFQTKEENELRILSDVGEKTVTEYLIYLYPEVAKNMTMEEFHVKSKLAFKSFYTKVLKSNTFRNTLCHGDAWATNIMFKYNADNSPVDCKVVDFQLTRYCPPVQDVMSCIYLTTPKDTRTKYLSLLLDEYYEELSKIVTSFGFDMEKVLSAVEFQKSCHYMKSQAVCQALFYAPINLTRAEDRVGIFGDPQKYENIMKKDRSPFIEEMMKKYPFYKVHIGELVEDLYDVCENEQY